jgi:ubiquinone/menaquinone biosynthesis C-methylase UbiE
MSGDYAANLTNHNPTVYNTNASFVYSAKFTNAVLGLLDAKPGEKIIDLGCGTGELTRQLKEAVGKEGVVVGVDSSDAMVRPFSQKSVIKRSAQIR